MRIKLSNVSYTVLVSGFLGGVGLAITFTGALFVVAIASFVYQNLMAMTGYITNPTSNLDIISFVNLFAVSSLPLGLVGLVTAFVGQIPKDASQIISLRIMKVTRGGLYEFLTIYASLILFAFFIILFFPPVFSMVFAPGILVFGLFLADILHDIWLWWARKFQRLLTRGKAIT